QIGQGDHAPAGVREGRKHERRGSGSSGGLHEAAAGERHRVLLLDYRGPAASVMLGRRVRAVAPEGRSVYTRVAASAPPPSQTPNASVAYARHFSRNTQVKAVDLRPGTAVRMDGKLYVVTKFEHRTPGNLRAFIQAKL